MSMNASAPSFVPSTASGGVSNSNEASRNKSNNTKHHNGKKRSNKKRSSNNANRDYNRVVSDLDDLNLVQVAQRTGGSTDKKGRVSLNHLLSFSFPERQEAPATSHRKPKVTSYQPFNKERFINANFRFMLNPTGNYIYQLADPDINFDWDTIEQVLISSAEAQSCPICLSPPTAARVTKCGHIYCLPCILHYLELRESKKNWRKCPICWDSIYEADLKPVRIMKPYAVSDHASSSATTTTAAAPTTLSCGVTDGDRVNMSLMQRSNDSTLAFPLSDTWPLPPNVTCNYMKPDTPLIPWHFTPGAMTFARFMLASPDYLRREYNRDCVELNDAMADAKGWGSAEEMPFIEKSLDQILAKMKQLNQQDTKELELAIQTSDMMFEAVAKYAKKHGKTASTHQQPVQTVDSVEKVEQVPEAYRQYQLAHQAGEDIGANQAASASTTSAAPTTTHQRHTNNNNNNSHSSNTPATDFYFYQAVDGQHVYLHPLDIRILKHEFGEYDQFPRQLQVQATSVQESTLTEDLRKKCKYLGHLPLACDVTFMEINVKDIVSAETIQVYNQELVARVKKRKDKERKEDQRRKQAESKQKLQVVKEQEAERHMLENDPFFSMYRPAMTAEESEEQLSQALSESTASLAPEEDPSAHASGGPRTVWGTRQVMSREEELMMNQTHDWADHIVINKSHRKRRGRKH
ncbi:hypothetical protein HMPREF1544_09790 [Mucor circinelloides 1006PhL]|uniref:RING-type domain-containing protein n=1 Tax=Mucor circinelloides f. circinelloides (strain 1006PhL) TaxID=1220926 RepID=S2J5J5_MUCC1|nr:hypothetical protein HMPREF1544_09790 [Mucor circinelloides 1006PhL]KAG1117566.1 hypothetical protein G6F42_013403 [Rhizopus arrhizus]